LNQDQNGKAKVLTDQYLCQEEPTNVWNRKINAFQKILNEIRLREPAMMFMNRNASQDDIVKNKNADIKFIAHGTFHFSIPNIREVVSQPEIA
jgi:hypothetical protein